MSAENILEYRKPDFIMDIKATKMQLASFWIEVRNSNIIRMNHLNQTKGGVGSFEVPNVVFDFSKDAIPIERYKQFHVEDKNTVSFQIMNTGDDIRSYPNAYYVSLSYFTPKTKPRTDVPGEYRSGDYFELFIRNKDGSEETFYLERNLLVHKKSR